ISPNRHFCFNNSTAPKNNSLFFRLNRKRSQNREKMGAFVKLVDFLLFFVFLVIALAAPLFDAQTCLPSDYFPEALVDLKEWYGKEFGDYLTTEKPHFFVGMIWLELLFQWPLAILNLYAILGSKPWFNTSCLIYGASLISTMVVPILADMVLSEKDTEKMMMIYAPFLGAGVVALLRGFVPHSAKSGSGAPKRPAFGRKKRV
ncbi:Sigma intracellular receptor 2, partial [Linum perenne]